MPLVPGEVLGDHHGLVQDLKVHPGVAHPVKQLIRVPDGGVAVVGVDVHGTARLLLDVPANGPQAVLQAEEDLVLKGPEAAQQHRLAADGIAHRAALHAAEFQQTINIGGEFFLQCHRPAVKLDPGSQGVQPLLRLGNVAGAARDGHGDLAGAAHHLLLPGGHHPGGQGRPEMQAKETGHIVLLKDPALAQVLCPAGRLLGRLEDQ